MLKQTLTLQSTFRLRLTSKPSAAASAETGAIPDLAEAALLGMGKYSEGDNTSGVEAVIGRRNVLTILWDAKRPDHPNDITPDELDTALGYTAGYYGSVSGGRFKPDNAGVLGPYDAIYDQADHYWNHPEENGEGICQDGYTSGAKHRRSEAIKLADTDFNFSAHDRNNDGRVDPNELAIVVVYKEISSGSGLVFGQALQSVSAQSCPEHEALELDGVQITGAIDWFVDRPHEDWIVLAHELGHGVAITLDGQAGWYSGRYALLSGPCPAGPPPQGDAPLNNVLAWADCSPSPYNLRNWSALPVGADPLDPPSTEMSYHVAITP
ncbi:MAG: hypothetical protein ACRDIU_08915 [Actinomycetota bacterium]